MYVDGKLMTGGEKTRLHTDPFGVTEIRPGRVLSRATPSFHLPGAIRNT